MQTSSTGLRIAARLLILALSAFAFVVIGCTGAQAIPASPSPAAVSVPGPVSVLGPAVQVTPGTAANAQSVVTAVQELPACNPGRVKVRLEHNAITPGQGLFPPGPELSGSALPRNAHPEVEALQAVGRIPAALTHLDLGILRT